MSDLFQLGSGLINGCCVVLQYFGNARDFLFRLCVTLFFDTFSNSRQRLGSIAGVIARGINQVLVPGTAQQSVRIRELAFRLKELNVQPLKRLRRGGSATLGENLDGL